MAKDNSSNKGTGLNLVSITPKTSGSFANFMAQQGIGKMENNTNKNADTVETNSSEFPIIDKTSSNSTTQINSIVDDLQETEQNLNFSNENLEEHDTIPQLNININDAVGEEINMEEYIAKFLTASGRNSTVMKRVYIPTEIIEKLWIIQQYGELNGLETTIQKIVVNIFRSHFSSNSKLLKAMKRRVQKSQDSVDF